MNEGRKTGRDFLADELGVFVIVEVFKAADGGGDPWITARLSSALFIEDVDYIRGVYAVARPVVTIGRILAGMLVEKPVSDAATAFIELDSALDITAVVEGLVL